MASKAKYERLKKVIVENRDRLAKQAELDKGRSTGTNDNKATIKQFIEKDDDKMIDTFMEADPTVDSR